MNPLIHVLVIISNNPKEKISAYFIVILYQQEYTNAKKRGPHMSCSIITPGTECYHFHINHFFMTSCICCFNGKVSKAWFCSNISHHCQVQSGTSFQTKNMQHRVKGVKHIIDNVNANACPSNEIFYLQYGQGLKQSYPNVKLYFYIIFLHDSFQEKTIFPIVHNALSKAKQSICKV